LCSGAHSAGENSPGCRSGWRHAVCYGDAPCLDRSTMAHKAGALAILCQSTAERRIVPNSEFNERFIVHRRRRALSQARARGAKQSSRFIFRRRLWGYEASPAEQWRSSSGQRAGSGRSAAVVSMRLKDDQRSGECACEKYSLRGSHAWLAVPSRRRNRLALLVFGQFRFGPAEPREPGALATSWCAPRIKTLRTRHSPPRTVSSQAAVGPW